MRRREFSTLLGGAATASTAWPFAANTQQKATPVIGFLLNSTPNLVALNLAAFRQGLSETGYVEGQKLTIEYRSAEGRFDRLPALAANLVDRKVDMLVAAAPLAHTRRKAQRRLSQSSSLPTSTRSGMVWSPVSPVQAATSRASASSLPI